MSGASSGDDTESVQEVPTEVPSDLEEGYASGEGVQGPQRPAVTPASSATLDLDEVPAMARQLAEELAIPWGTGWRTRCTVGYKKHSRKLSCIGGCGATSVMT